jgi:arylsulfatase A-like enzyme
MNRLFQTLIALSLCFIVAAQAQDKRPNIVIIMADDMGFSDIGCFGSEIATPNLDRLAANGLRLTQFYNTGRCCPSRASLLTGLYSHQAGVGHMVENKGLPGYLGYLNDRCVTIAEVLRQNGYRTLMTGKWHIGNDKPHWPTDRGFDRYFGLVSGGSNYFRLDPNRILALDDKSIPAPPGYYATDAFTEYAIQFIEETRAKSQPFFLYLAYTAPHWPLHAIPEDIAKYRGKYMDGWDALREKRYQKMIDIGIIDKSSVLSKSGTQSWENAKNKDEWDLRMATYAAQIERRDAGIVKVMNKLEEMGAEDNTLVVFISDNGGCAEDVDRGKDGAEIGTADSFTSYRKPWANVSNTPFRQYKHWNHEGGIASPFVAHWPSKIKKGEISHSPAHIIDLMPTCLAAAGASYPKQFNGREILQVEGKSLMPIFEDKTKEVHDVIYWEHEGNRAVRQGNWKLVAENNSEWELYDLKTDRSELKNLATQHPEKVLELGELYRKWADRCGVIPPKILNKKK